MNRCIDLRDIELDVSQSSFEHLVRVDHIYIGSKLKNHQQASLLKSFGVKRAIDLKASGETDFDDKKSFEHNGVEYIHFPITDLSQIQLLDLQKFGELISNKNDGNIFVYCMSGNRVGALMALNAGLVCGHPKKRAYEIGVKLGMSRDSIKETVKKLIWSGGICE